MSKGQSLQDPFLNALRRERVPVSVYLVNGIKREGTTILLTTHYLDEAAHLADRAAVIANGALRALAPIDELGGREARTPRVRWRDDEGLRHEERTTDPQALVRSTATPMHDLEVIRPSLEDVYLDLVEEPDLTSARAAAR